MRCRYGYAGTTQWHYLWSCERKCFDCSVLHCRYVSVSSHIHSSSSASTDYDRILNTADSAEICGELRRSAAAVWNESAVRRSHAPAVKLFSALSWAELTDCTLTMLLRFGDYRRHHHHHHLLRQKAAHKHFKNNTTIMKHLKKYYTKYYSKHRLKRQMPSIIIALLTQWLQIIYSRGV